MQVPMAASAWRTAIVTGAASGIGRCFAETLAARGTAVGLIDVSADGIAAVATALRGQGRRIETRVADVSAGGAAATALSELTTALGGLDLLVNCAAVLGPGHFAEQAAERFERVI